MKHLCHCWAGELSDCSEGSMPVCLELLLTSLPLSHQRDVDTVGGGDGGKRNEASNQGRDVLQQRRGHIKQEGGL